MGCVEQHMNKNDKYFQILIKSTPTDTCTFLKNCGFFLEYFWGRIYIFVKSKVLYTESKCLSQ